MCGLFRQKCRSDWLCLTVSYLVACTHKHRITRLQPPLGVLGLKIKGLTTHILNLRGTQMSRVFFEPYQVLLRLPLNLCEPRFCVFILRCSQYCMACLRGDPWSPRNIVETGPRGPCEPIQKHLLVCSLLYTIYSLWYNRSHKKGVQQGKQATTQNRS